MKRFHDWRPRKHENLDDGYRKPLLESLRKTGPSNSCLGLRVSRLKCQRLCSGTGSKAESAVSHGKPGRFSSTGKGGSSGLHHSHSHDKKAHMEDERQKAGKDKTKEYDKRKTSSSTTKPDTLSSSRRDEVSKPARPVLTQSECDFLEEELWLRLELDLTPMERRTKWMAELRGEQDDYERWRESFAKSDSDLGAEKETSDARPPRGYSTRGSVEGRQEERITSGNMHSSRSERDQASHKSVRDSGRTDYGRTGYY